MTKRKPKKQMSTVQDRPTVGQLLADTHAEHLKQKFEVGEFVEEIGNKEVMTEIWRQIEARRALPHWQPKFYLLVFLHKDHLLHRVIKCFIQSRHTAPKMEPGLTLFSYDTSKDELQLEWVLPNEESFKMYHQHPDKFDPFLIHCIDCYLADKETGYIKI